MLWDMIVLSGKRGGKQRRTVPLAGNTKRKRRSTLHLAGNTKGKQYDLIKVNHSRNSRNNQSNTFGDGSRRRPAQPPHSTLHARFKRSKLKFDQFCNNETSSGKRLSASRKTIPFYTRPRLVADLPTILEGDE